VLKSAGYRTGMFGKWHLGDQPAFLPTRQGFDEFFGLPYSHDIHPFNPKDGRTRFPPLPLLDGETVIEMEPDADYLTRRITASFVNPLIYEFASPDHSHRSQKPSHIYETQPAQGLRSAEFHTPVAALYNRVCSFAFTRWRRFTIVWQCCSRRLHV
jgi:hypothetical protein